MRQASLLCGFALLLNLLTPIRAHAEPKLKLEDGRYGVLNAGKLLTGSEHTWTFWKLPNGQFELEDHFHGDAGLRLGLGLMGALAAGGAKMSPELRDELQNKVMPTELSATYDSKLQLLSLTVKGTKPNGESRVALKCFADSQFLHCDGLDHRTKFRTGAPSPLFWFYGFPGLLRTWLPSAQNSSSAISDEKVVYLTFESHAPAAGNAKPAPAPAAPWGKIPSLESADLSIKNLGPAELEISGRIFHAQKFDVKLKPTSSAPYSLTFGPTPKTRFSPCRKM